MLLIFAIVVLFLVAVLQGIVIIAISMKLRELHMIAEKGGSTLALNHLASGTSAPSFSAKCLITSQLVRETDFRGKPLVLVFVSTGCGRCREILSALPNVTPRALERVAFYCIGPEEECRALVSHVLPGTIALHGADDRTPKRFGIGGTPTAVFLTSAWEIERYGFPRDIKDILSYNEVQENTSMVVATYETEPA